MVRLNDEERARLDELAGPKGVAEYLRACGLRHQPRLARTIPEVNQTVWRDLAPVLANLNQLARHANDGHTVGSDLAHVLEDVRRQVIVLRAALLGRDEGEEGQLP
jgi:hypothetical protein